MNELIEITKLNDIEVVDSRIIANELGIEHSSLIRTIKNYQQAIEKDFGRVGFEIVPLKTNGGFQNSSIAYLTEEQAIFVGTLSRNTETVIAFKAKLVKSFSEYRKAQQKRFVIPQTLSEALRLSAELAEQNEKLQLENVEQKEKIVELLPDAEYTNKVLSSNTGISTVEIAKELKMRSAQALNDELVKRKIQYKVNDHYVLTANYTSFGYVEYETIPIQTKEGNYFTRTTMKWTEKGRRFLHNIFNISYANSVNQKLEFLT